MSPSSLLSRLNPFPGKGATKNSEKSKRKRDGEPQEGAVASSTLSATSSRSIAGTSTAPLASTASRNQTAPSATVASMPPSLPERLWDQAYDDLKADDSILVSAYEEVLSRELSGNASREYRETTIEQTNPMARRSQMIQLVQTGLMKTEKEAKVKQAIRETMQPVLSAKDMIDSAVQAVPQAALAWTGICLALQILINPTKETEANRKGIIYVISRMDWYWNLSKLLLKESEADGGSSAGLRCELEKRIVDLYKALLSYQMKSVCSYYRNRGFVFLGDIIKFDDWDGSLKSVQDAENAVRQDADVYSTQQIRSHLEELVDVAKNQETKLLQGIHQALQDQALMQVDTKNDECLKDLRLTDPRHDKTRIEQTKGGLLEDSCQWILNHPDFRRWRNDENSRLLWIKGDPGKGKTMLLIGIIKELSEQLNLTSDPRLLSFFFCQGTDVRLNNATVVLRGLIYLLLIQQKTLISYVRKKYDHAGRQLFEDANAFYALSEIFRDMLHDPSLREAYLIVDALDECETGLAQLLEFIIPKGPTSHRVKWIVSSRNKHDIQERLGLDDTQMRLSLELNAECVSHAVDIYINYKISQLASLKNDETLQGKVQDQIRQKANGTFLWVALVFKELQDVESWDVLQVIEEMPADLVPLYDRMIQQIQRLKRTYPEYCRLVLSTVTLTYRPLHLLELGVLSGLPDQISGNTQAVIRIVEMCGSFLTIREDYVSLIHQSAKDYLSTNVSTAIFPSGRREVHYDMFSRSLQVMSKTLRKDIYDLRHPGILIDQVKAANPDPLAPLRYCCVYWIDHLCEVGSSSSQYYELRDSGAVHVFLQNVSLYWLEALSLMKSISNGVFAITKLEDLLRAQSNESELFNLIQDARRFILFNRWAIENAPLQAYASALIFSPTCSLIRQLFKKEQPGWITTKPIIESNWSLCLQTLEGHTGCVNSVTFSHDSQRLASASHDCTIRLWDTETGEMLQTLRGHTSSVSSVAFSHDSRRLASASHDHTVRLWNAETGEMLRILRGHTSSVSSVAFLHDSQRLASASHDHTVQLWDAETGEMLQTLKGHTSLVSSVAFSHNSQRLASASHDHTVQLWDAETGEMLQTLRGHTSSVSSVAFSHDSQRLASASHDRTVRLWDAETGEALQTLEGHTGWVFSVAFSHDSKWLASVSGDCTVRLWDAKIGELLQTLEGHISSVLSVVFSHDSRRLASASEDYTIRLWDTKTGEMLQTIEGHTDRTRSVAFSHDFQQLASASHDHTVRLWDAKTGDLLQTLKSHTNWVRSVAFSHDSQRLASASHDCTVRLWDSETGKLLQTLKGHTGWVSSVTFSHDSQRLASASYDGTVRLWDVKTGELLQTLEGHTDWVMSVAFSHDSQRLASALHDCTVRLWDVKAGELLQTLEGHTDWVSSVAFSHDSQRLASASHDHTVRLWDAETGEMLQTYNIGTCLSYISFDPHDKLYLLTEIGPIFLDPSVALAPTAPTCAAQEPRRSGYGLSSNSSWITRHGQNVLWLPSEYRPSCSAVAEWSIAIGCTSGRVLIIGFSLNVSPI